MVANGKKCRSGDLEDKSSSPTESTDFFRLSVFEQVILEP